MMPVNIPARDVSRGGDAAWRAACCNTACVGHSTLACGLITYEGSRILDEVKRIAIN